MGDSDKKVPIQSFTGGEIGEALVGCYFKPKPNDTFDFYDKDDKEKGKDITVGSDFSFQLDEMPDITWHLSLISSEMSNDKEVLKGGWWDGKDPSEADGTYQAEAGGSGAEEEPNAASAGGCAA